MCILRGHGHLPPVTVELTWFCPVFAELHPLFFCSIISPGRWGVVSPCCAARKALTEHSISSQAGFPFSRPFWASQVQGKGEASGSCQQMGDEEEEKRGACRGDRWAGQ